MGCHFSAKDAFPLSGAKLDFSLENKTNKMREERFHFKHLRYLNILRLLRSCLKFLRAVCMHTKSLRLCPTLCNPMDHSLLGSSVHGILQARILEWVAMPSFRGSFQPRDWTGCPELQADSLPLSHQGSSNYRLHTLYISKIYNKCTHVHTHTFFFLGEPVVKHLPAYH